jgi:hypothetical protein
MAGKTLDRSIGVAEKIEASLTTKLAVPKFM